MICQKFLFENGVETITVLFNSPVPNVQGELHVLLSEGDDPASIFMWHQLQIWSEASL